MAELNDALARARGDLVLPSYTVSVPETLDIANRLEPDLAYHVGSSRRSNVVLRSALAFNLSAHQEGRAG